MNLLKKVKNSHRLGKPKPLWFDAVTRNNPPYNPAMYKDLLDVGKPKKIVYPEDKIRINFHSRFPLEALKPTVFKQDIENLPTDSIEYAIKSQVNLMEAYGIEEDVAFKTAERIFIENRKKIEIENRIAREQAEILLENNMHSYTGPLTEILNFEKQIMEANK